MHDTDDATGGVLLAMLGCISVHARPDRCLTWLYICGPLFGVTLAELCAQIAVARGRWS